MRDDFRICDLDNWTALWLPSSSRHRSLVLRRVGSGYREAIGVSSGELAQRMGTSRQLWLQQEKAEAEGRITLRSLRTLANALDCDLVYALVPEPAACKS